MGGRGSWKRRNDVARMARSLGITLPNTRGGGGGAGKSKDSKKSKKTASKKTREKKGPPVTFSGKFKVNFESKDVRQNVTTFFGKPTSGKQIGRMVGAPDGAKVTIKSWNGKTVTVVVKHPYYKEQSRVLYKDEKGRISFNNIVFKLDKAKSPKGTGTAVFRQQVLNARKNGLHSIMTFAARGDKLNGYYTWARLGYNKRFNKTEMARIDPKFGKVRTLQQLMAMKGGAKWWKKNGWEFDGTFSLGKNSVSMRVFNAYLKEKKLDRV